MSVDPVPTGRLGAGFVQSSPRFGAEEPSPVVKTCSMPLLRCSDSRLFALPALLLAATIAGCTTHRPAVVGPAVDAQHTALDLEDRTRLRRPSRIMFQWELNESGVRVHGRGVARLESPYRARLDLFLGNGETVVRAALVGEDLRLPPGTPRDILPPPDLMWAVLGVFRPEQGSKLMGADRLVGGALRLRYLCPDGEQLRYRIEDGRVTTLEVLDGGHTTQQVRLSLSGDSRYPVEATYRNMKAFRELKLKRESVEQVDAFPPEIWNPVR